MAESVETLPAKWYVLHTLANQEAKIKNHLETYLKAEEMEDFILEILMPTEMVSEVKSGKKKTKVRKLYPGYLFIHMRLYDDLGQLMQRPWNFVRDTDGVITFIGGDHPVPLNQGEISNILQQVEESDGKEVPKVKFEAGDEVKITDGPFLNFVGRIEEIDTENGKLKVSVSIFGRSTPVELEFWQVERHEET